MKRIGLYFGSFNPIHTGHLIVAEYFATQRGFDEVWLVVSPQNPMKSTLDLAPADQRLEMVKLAIENNPVLQVSDVEFYLDQPSYTINTLKHFKKEFQEYVFTLLLGEDNLAGLFQWRHYEEILKGWTIEIFPRHHHSTVKTESLMALGQITVVSAPRIEISSTLIRTLLQEGKSIRYLVPDNVASYISDHGLYH